MILMRPAHFRLSAFHIFALLLAVSLFSQSSGKLRDDFTGDLERMEPLLQALQAHPLGAGVGTTGILHITQPKWYGDFFDPHSITDSGVDILTHGDAGMVLGLRVRPAGAWFYPTLTQQKTKSAH